jgi:hypothetical protein
MENETPTGGDVVENTAAIELDAQTAEILSDLEPASDSASTDSAQKVIPDADDLNQDADGETDDTTGDDGDGFKSFWNKTAEEVTSRVATEEEKPIESEDKTEDDGNGDGDEKAAEKTEEKTEEEEKSEDEKSEDEKSEEEKSEDEKEEKPEKADRTSNFKKLQTDFETYKSEVEQLGGIEGLKLSNEFFQKFTDPERVAEAVAELKTIGHGEEIASELIFQFLDDSDAGIDNRVVTFNHILAEDFGFKEDELLERPEVETVLNWLGVRFATLGKAEVLDDLKFQLEMSGETVEEIKAAKAAESDEKGEEKQTATTKGSENWALQLNQEITAFEDEVFAAASADTLAKYELTDFRKQAVLLLTSAATRNSPEMNALLPIFAEGKPKSGVSWTKYKDDYRTLLKNTAEKVVNDLFGSPNAVVVKKGEQPTKQTTRQTDLTGKDSRTALSNKVPKTPEKEAETEEKDEATSFSSVWKSASEKVLSR